MVSGQSIIDNLQEKGWIPANSRQHPLGRLHEKSLDSHKLVALLGAKNKIGANYFQIFLQTDSGELSNQPVVRGIYHQGKYPGYNWIEISNFLTHLSFSTSRQNLDLTTNGLAQQLFQYLADLIPPGGHMMVEYDSPEQQDTARSLALGIPIAVTPLGYKLFSIGCGAGFRDWYFAEGGTEGPRKLQGFKALNSQHAQTKMEEIARELKPFLNRTSSAADLELMKAARDRAQTILNKLERT